MPLHSAEPGVFRHTYPLHYPDADASGLVRLTSLLNLLQIHAGDHTASRGYDYLAQKESGAYWVLSRLVLQVDQWPGWPGSLTVDTWSRSTKAVFALRDYRFASPGAADWQGRASTAWVMLKDRRPQRPEAYTALYHQTCPETPLAELPGALPALDQGASHLVSTVKADWEDVDLNGHVNNVSGVGWSLAAHDFAFLSAYRPRTVEVNFLAEMFCGQSFELRRTDLADEGGLKRFDYAVVRTDDGAVTLRMRTAFAPR